MSQVQRLVRRVVAPLSRTRLFRRFGPRIMPTFERLVSVLSGGRAQASGLLVPSLVLHTTGARSGLPRDAHLMYTPDGNGRALVAGSNFADERHPAWTANLLAHPDATITVRGRTLAVRAWLLSPSETETAWATIERQWPDYRDYERSSGRTVRIFALQPVRPSTDQGAS